MGEGYASQTRSDFDWYNPHLYNYLHPLLFYKTVGFFFSFSFERRSAGVFFTLIYVHINAKKFIHAFMHLCLVRLWLIMWWRKNG